jgi:hypothetical protein
MRRKITNFITEKGKRITAMEMISKIRLETAVRKNNLLMIRCHIQSLRVNGVISQFKIQLLGLKINMVK